MSSKAQARPRPVGVDHRPLRDVVCDAIRDRIASGVHRPGERLVEDRLADELGVSRNPVREALRALEVEGYVELIPGEERSSPTCRPRSWPRSSRCAGPSRRWAPGWRTAGRTGPGAAPGASARHLDPGDRARRPAAAARPEHASTSSSSTWVARAGRDHGPAAGADAVDLQPDGRRPCRPVAGRAPRAGRRDRPGRRRPGRRPRGRPRGRRPRVDLADAAAVGV